jgi:hypothetical protein
MKRNIFFLIGSAVALLLCTGCFFFPMVEGSGFLASTTYGLSGFTRIEASNAFKVRVVQDTVYSVSVISDDNLVQYLDVSLSSDTLKIGLEFGYNYINTTLTAEVHLPSLSGLSLSGACEARVEAGFAFVPSMNLVLSGASEAEVLSLICGSLDANVSGSSGLTIDSLTAGSLSAEVSGASDVTAVGSAGSESLNVSGSSDVHLIDCPTNQASVTVSGASSVWVFVPSGTLSVNASGASLLYYKGNPSFPFCVVTGASGIVHQL